MSISPRYSLALPILVALTAGSSCTAGPPRSEVRVLPARDYQDIYKLAEQHVDQALYYKPSKSAFGLDQYLAPLIIQAVQDQVGGSHCYRLVARRGDVSEIDMETGSPAVYFARDTALIDQRLYEQLVFLWFMSNDRQSPAESLARAQGLRMTLDSAGEPVIWEVLAFDRSLRMVFVSDRLELAAKEHFGEPLPGRKHSIEPALSHEPLLVVPRVLSDGPVAMGPIVYLEAGTGRVSTIICRCMPSQLDHIVEMISYDLRPLDEVLDLDLGSGSVSESENSSAGLPFSVRELKSTASIAHHLRLPPDF